MNQEQLEAVKTVALKWDRYCELADDPEADITAEDFKFASYAALVLENEGLIHEFAAEVYEAIDAVGEKLDSLLEELEAE